jgi:fused signal recognition particle receptor
MVFNWFRRKFNEDDTPEPAVEQEAESPPAEEEASPVDPEPEATAVDALSWAKAAYQNIQKRQQAEEVAALAQSDQTITDDAETAAEAIADFSEPTVELPAAEDQVEAAISVDETQPAPLAEVEAAAIAEPIAEPEPTLDAELTTAETVETEAETAEAPASPESIVEPPLEPASEPEPALAVEVADAEAEQESAPEIEAELSRVEPSQANQPAVMAEAEDPAEQQTQPEAESLPFWARTEADRLERLEQLNATAAISEPASSLAPEPAPESVAPVVEPVTVTPTLKREIDQRQSEDLSLDEGFLWSAQVLAAQGRRPEEISLEEITWLQKLRRGLDKTRRGLVNQLKAVVGQGPLNADAVMEVESLLLQADVGVEATDRIIQALQTKLRQEALPPDAAIAYLKQILCDLLEQPLKQGYSAMFTPEKDRLNIWLMTGVNGVGKTTTIGKIAHVATISGYECLIGAADTFRAAAVEQVKVWGQRSNVEVIANPGKNTDPAAVVFDAISAAQSRGAELLLVDTAGRLQNKQNLMEELRKIRRIVQKKAPDAKVESLLVLDATLGQNGLRQAQVFAEAAQLTGVVVTKLDGTAKGGVALAVVQELGLPIRFIGAGEGIEDLRPFSSYEFVEALLSS